MFVNLASVEDVYELSDVVESDEEINPKSVICCEPLIVPAGVLSPLLLTNPNAVIWAEPLITSVLSNVLKTLPLTTPLGNCVK